MVSFKDFSIKRKLITLTMLIALAVMVLFTFAFLGYEWTEAKEAKIAEATVLTEVAAESIGPALMFNDSKAATDFLSSLRKAIGVKRAEVYTKNGEFFAFYAQENGSGRIDISGITVGQDHFHGASVIISRPIFVENELFGTIYVEDTLQQVQDWIKHGSFVGILLVSIGSLVALGLSSIFERQISGPIIQITDAVKEVSKTKNYTLRVSYSALDELGHLIKFFNQMLGELEERDRTLLNYQLDLEKKVSDRTKELTDEVVIRAKAEQALRREQEQLRAIIRNSPVAIAMLDRNLAFMVHSTKWIEDFDLSGDLIGRKLVDISPKLSSHWNSEMESCLRGNSEKRSEDTLVRQDGELIYLNWAMQPWYLVDGNQGGVVIVSTRIDGLVKAREAALHTAQIKSSFLANMSHELRTPLNGIIGFTDLLLEVQQISGEQRSYLDAIKSSGTLLLSIINDVLDFSKLEQGKVSLEELPFEVKDVIHSSIRIMKGASDRKGLELRACSDATLGEMVIGDSFRLQQILMNLLGNAIKFTGQGEIVVSSSLSEQTDDFYEIQFCVSDTGIGIPPDKVETIFEAFSQADGSTTRKYGGTGLGLSISQQLVKLMGGKMWVESELGKGSHFYFTTHFRRQKDSFVRSEVDNSVLRRSDATVVEQACATLKIMVAEDNPLNQRLITAILTKLGHEVVIAKNGLEATDIIAQNKFDIVLMDIQMPVMGGLEATRLIRQDITNSSLPIVALTAHAFEENKQECLSVGMNDYLTKPIDKNKLCEILSKYSKVT